MGRYVMLGTGEGIYLAPANVKICHNLLVVGRYKLSGRKPLVEDYSGIFSSDEDRNPRSNIAPTQPVLAVMTFGLVVITVAIMLSSGCGSSPSNVTSPPSLVSIAVTPPGVSIAVNGTQQFTAKGTYSDSSTQDLTSSATWTSSQTGIATITAKGLATGAAVGSTTITATSGSVTGSTSLSVVITPTLVSIAVTPVNPSVAVGNTLQFVATGSYSDGSSQNLTSTATWSSSAPGVATISAGGLATGVSVGSSTISAKLSGVTGSTTLTVTSSLVSIAVTPVNGTVAVGFPLQFDAVGTYSDGSTQDLTVSVTWSSSTPAVATITAGGLAIGGPNSGSSTTVTATSGGISGSTTLTVSTSTSPPAVAPDWLEFVGDGSEGAYSCASGKCALGGEHWFSSFDVLPGATVVTSAQNTPIVIRSTGTCTVAGIISNSPNSGGVATTITGSGDFGGGGGGGGGGSTSGHAGLVNVGDAAIEIVSPGPGGAAGKNGGNGGNPVATQYHLLLSGGTFWPGGGGEGGQGGGSNGGAGGWGGGPIILVCQSINFPSTGIIDVSGGKGADSPGNNSGAGGGGGAGYVILSATTYIAPANTGTINTAGGPGGSCVQPPTGCGTGGSGGSGWSVAITIPQ